MASWLKPLVLTSSIKKASSILIVEWLFTSMTLISNFLRFALLRNDVWELRSLNLARHTWTQRYTDVIPHLYGQITTARCPPVHRKNEVNLALEGNGWQGKEESHPVCLI
tara:strand:+ start:2177 stop:2506 length:330 start_codon:yes stop_codon:yes gene_type:complete